jgi:hypothetical protein
MAKAPYHDIAALGIDHFLRTVLPQDARRDEQRDLAIFDGDVVVRRVRRGHHETVDDKKVEAVHVASALTGQQRQEIWTRAGMVPISLPRQPLVLPQWIRADIWGSLSVRIWPRRAAMISNVVDLRPARKGVAQRNDVHDVLLQA